MQIKKATNKSGLFYEIKYSKNLNLKYSWQMGQGKI